MPTATTEQLQQLYDAIRADQTSRVKVWADDPVKWVDDVLGITLADYQKTELAALPTKRRVAVRGPRGSGKTMPAALAFWWFATTREMSGVDWKIVSTAGSWDQIRLYLWPEIHKWHRQINWETVGLPRPRIGVELLRYHLKMEYGEGFGRATDDPDLIEGAHASEMLVLLDEGKSISDGIWDAIEGFFASPGEHYAFALSTPGAPTGRFSDIHHRKPGLEDWYPIHVTLQDALDAGRVDPKWAEQRKAQWGETSRLYRCHVLAEFAGEEDGVIPLAWVEAAIDRGKNLDKDCRPNRLAIDVADTGEDRTAIAFRDEWDIYKIEVFPPGEGDVLLQAERVEQRSVKGTTVVVDSIGVGAGTKSALTRNKDLKVVPFVASAGTNRRDASGEIRFNNKRSAAWWNVRELLHPETGENISLPDHPEMLGDLTAPKWREVAGGKIAVESKDEIRRRVGRSTDVGDTIIMVLWEEKTRRSLVGVDLTTGLGR